MDVDWDDWRVVWAAMELGSFTAAAEGLRLGQATVSRRVARVEELLGLELFERHRTGLVSTPAAVTLRPHLEGVAAAMSQAATALEGHETAAEGVVRLTAPPGVSADVGPALALWLREHHPGVRLQVLADIAFRDLGAREADVALRLGPTNTGDLLVRRLASVEGCLAATPELVAAGIDPIPLVGWGPPMDQLPSALFLAEHLPQPLAFAASDYLVLRAAIQAGVGAGFVSVREADAWGLVRLPFPVDLPSVPLFLVVHRALRRVPRVAAVIEGLEVVLSVLQTAR